MSIFSPKHNPSAATDLPNEKIRKADTNGSVVALYVGATVGATVDVIYKDVKYDQNKEWRKHSFRNIAILR